MIPYFTNPLRDVLPSPFNDTWGVLVCIGFVVGMEVARARAIRLGLDVRDVIDGIIALIVGGFVIGHLVHVLAYNPHLLAENGPIVLLQVWAGLSSFGGFVGAVAGSLLFYKVIRKRPWVTHAEVVLFGFPFGWFFGRLGCFTAHDHIGRLTDFPLAVAFPDGARHDLGLYEAMWTLVIAIVFWVAGRRERVPGFFFATWCLMYAPVRFGLDFLRNTDLPSADVRWGGLTPAQWGCIVMVGAGLWALAYARGRVRAGWAPTPRTPAGTASGT